ncbi:MAG: YlmC/YmxH family sporulation protein [Oscillospiraceae bacterium]|jgi:YlmC/YmxH family sporulation protein|nr:YlmC/YmxH family sporulation protein [Oscillospiraceae bacterium]
MQCQITDLRYKEVINISNGFRLGIVTDAMFNAESGQIVSLIAPGPPRFLGLFGRCEDYIIPWHSIKKIGSDIILIETDHDYGVRPPRKKGFTVTGL